jgi:hypothetical protein
MLVTDLDDQPAGAASWTALNRSVSSCDKLSEQL